MEIAEAKIEIDDAQVELEAASLEQAKTNLDLTRITSPIKGTVIDRRVNIGRTVSGRLDGECLFLIAENLKRLQAWVSVSEADIGQVHVGQTARFTVNATGAKVFEGQIDQIRLNATADTHVVTYTVVVSVDNSKEELLPYETASVTIKGERRTNVLLVPNRALGLHSNGYSFVLPSMPIAEPKRRNHVWVKNGSSVRRVGPHAWCQ